MSTDVVTAAEALTRLREGNRRFVAGVNGEDNGPASALPTVMPGEQRPFAIILGCSDSRVPAEIVFDQGLGDLFVVRVAGNVASPPQIGSVEYAAENFDTQLVVVLGHSNCGAVTATLEELQRPTDNPSPNLEAIVDQIRPCLHWLSTADFDGDREALLQRAVRANVMSTVDQLQRKSTIIEKMVSEDSLRIVGAEYSLESGEVEFLDDTDVDKPHRK